MENLIYGGIYTILAGLVMVYVYYTHIKPLPIEYKYIQFIKWGMISVFFIGVYGMLSTYTPKMKVLRYVDSERVTEYNNISKVISPPDKKVDGVDKLKILREYIENSIEK